MRLVVCALVAAMLGACPGHSAVPCVDDTNCDLTTGGACTLGPSGQKWCAYPDTSCDSGFRFSDQDVGDDVGGTCTPHDVNPGSKFTLTVALGGRGTGTIMADKTGLTCSGNSCTGTFDEGTTIQLAATATTGQFLGWSQQCSGTGACSVTMDSDRQVSALFGTPGEALWAGQLGSVGREFGQGISVDSNNDVIAVGEFTNSIMAGTNPLTSAGGSDIYVVKYAAATGTVVWAKRFGGTANDVALDVAVDDTRNVYVTGHFDGAVDFGGGVLNSSGGQGDIFALKLTSDGNYVWARKFGGSTFETGEGIAVRNGAVAVVGFFNGALTVDATPLPYAGSADLFAFSLSAATGATNWAKAFGGSAIDQAYDVAIDGSDNVDIVGAFAGTVNFGGGAISTPGNFADVLLLKLGGASGAYLLASNFGSSVNDYGYGIAVDGSNNIYITGQFYSTASFGCSNQLTASQQNLADAFLVKYTQAGSCVWAKGFGGSGTFDRDARDVTTNAAGDVAFTGTFCGSITFGGPTLTAAGTCPNGDMFAARFAADGTHLNSVRAGGTSGEVGEAIAQGADGRFYVTGGFQGLAEFGDTAFTGAGDYDAFVVGLEAL